MTATAVSLVSLLWASAVAGEEVERRALAGLAATAKATVLQEQQAWDGAVRIVVSAAARPVALSALQAGDTVLAGQGVENVLATGPFAGVRLYSTTGDLVASAALPGVTPTAVDLNGPVRVTFGAPSSVGTPTARQVSVPVGLDGRGRLVVDIDMTQLLGKPADLAFDRTGTKLLVTTDGLIVAGSTGVGTVLRAEVNRAIAAAGKPVTTLIYSPYFGRMTVESYEPIADQGVGILVQQARSEVMAGADSLARLLHWVALAVGLLGAAVAVSLGLLVSRRSRRLTATERRLADSEAESRRRLERLLDAVPIGVLVATIEGKPSYANREARRMLGANGDTDPAAALALAGAPDGEPAHHETEIGVAGATVPVEVWRTAVEDGAGTLEFRIAAFVDVTQRRRVAEEMRDAEARFQGLLESAPDAIVVVDGDGLIRLVNRQTEVLFGYERSELVGQPVERLIPDRFAAHHPDLRTGFFHNPSVRAMGANLELAARRKDGSEFPVDISLSTLTTEEGVLVSAAVRDVTERKRAQAALLEREAELALARDQAVEASRLKSHFLANMSHEIRTPMNAVIGLTWLLLDTSLDDEQREYAGAVRSAGEALLDIINDILDFSKIEAGKLRLEVSDFDLRVVVNEVTDLLGGKAHEKGLELTTHVDPGVPIVVRGDPGRLRQILTNLVGNAVKFSEHGEIAIRIRASGAGDGPAVLYVEVTDQGIGISAADQRHLFRAFEQLDSSSSRRYGGTGLGLAISRQLVDMMGGEIGARSEAGAGSTFWFNVPLPPSGGERASPAALKQVAGEIRLLVAEDNPVNQLVAVRMLERMGYRADVAANGLEAVDALMRNDYAAVLMDCQMPELDGYEATHELRRQQGPSRRTPVIAMTAGATEGDRDRCIAAGMDDYLSKPVRSADLRLILAKWVAAN